MFSSSYGFASEKLVCLGYISRPDSNAVRTITTEFIMDHDIGLRRCGSLNLAQTHDRVIALQRRAAYILPTGMAAELIDSETARKLHPFLYTDDLQGAVYVPDDCIADPAAVVQVLASEAKRKGVKYFEGCQVKYVSRLWL